MNDIFINVVSSNIPTPPHSPLGAVQYAELQRGASGNRHSRNPSHITTPTSTWR